jgi:hypothetical protein
MTFANAPSHGVVYLGACVRALSQLLKEKLPQERMESRRTLPSQKAVISALLDQLDTVNVEVVGNSCELKRRE